MRRAGVVLGVLCIVLGGLLYLVRVRPSASRRTAAPRVARPVPPAIALEPAPPAWRLGQLHLGVWHVAGRVTFEGQGVPRAGVRLTSDEMGVGDWTLVAITADAAGRFDFGLVPAGRYHVRGESPGRLAGDVIIDLRKPKVSPAPEALDVALGPCAMRVFGTVRDTAGRGLALARVRATRAWFIYLANAVADAQGNYEVCAPSGTVHLEASAAGYGTQTTHRTDVRELHVDFALQPEAVIAGTVRDERGAPVDGADVAAETDGHLPGTVTESDGDGRFRLEGLNGAQHYIVVARSGDGAAEKPVVPTPGKTVEIELRLTARATLRGRVVAGGSPVTGATVLVEESERGRRFGSAISQADGRFEIAGLPRTRAHPRVRGYRLLEPKVVDLAALPPLVDLKVERLPVVAGRVVAGGRPAPRVAVELKGPDRPRDNPYHDTTAADGTFRIEGVEPSTYSLLVRSEEGLGVGPARTLDIREEDVTGLTIELGRGASVSGTVLGPDGAPLPDVIVNVYLEGWEDVGRAQTGVDGSFQIVSLLGGTEYRSAVYAQNDAQLRPAQGDFPRFQLPAGSELRGLRLVIGGGGDSISGHVLRAGRPVAGIEVVAIGGPGWPVPNYTDGAGAFTITSLRPDRYPLFFNRAGRQLHNIAGVMTGTTDVRVELPPTGSIEGTLVGFRERPKIVLGRGEVTAADVAGSEFVIADLPAGSYELIASSPSGEYARATVGVTNDDVAHVTLTGAGARVEGVVTEWPIGAPLAGARCEWIPFEPRWPGKFDAATTDAQGRFVMNVPPGKGGASCRYENDGLTAHAVVVDAPPGETTRIDVSIFLAEGLQVSDPTGLKLDLQQVVREAGGPFREAGLDIGDRILSVDGVSLAGISPNVWERFLGGHASNQPIAVTFERNGVRYSAEVTLPPRRPFVGGRL